MRLAALVMLLSALPGAVLASEGAVRALTVSGDACWAVGDAGLVLRGDDGGATWKKVFPSESPAGPPGIARTAPGSAQTAPTSALTAPTSGPTAPATLPADAGFPRDVNFTGVCFAGQDSGFAFGGRISPGNPAGAGVGVIYQTGDGGATWRPANAAGLGYLLGGRIDGQRGAVYGLPTRACPSGLWATVNGGRTWAPVRTESSGSLSGGGFAGVNMGCLVGPGGRIVSLRNLQEPPIRPKVVSGEALTAAAYADDETCWAVGDNGTVLASAPGGESWRPVALPTPTLTRRLADLEAVLATGKRELFLAGGLAGTIFHTADGEKLSALAAPSPGPVHALARAGFFSSDKNAALLAGGDGGRIWRSTDAGASWKLVHGQESVDVLFVLAPGDVSLYPAMAAQALAGSDVAVVYAAVPQLLLAFEPGKRQRGQVHMQASAAAAGAGGAAVLADFASIAGDDDAGPGAPGAQDILDRWSAGLDVPARQEMLRQLAAAIRLYRPKVLVRGPEADEVAGTLAENHLVSRLAAEAVKLAASPTDLPELAKLGLKPHRVERTCVGDAGNEAYTLPWRKAGRSVEVFATSFVGWRYPAGSDTSLSMLAERSICLLPWAQPLSRSADVTLYRSDDVIGMRPLLTSDLSPARLAWREPEGMDAATASGAFLRGPAILSAKGKPDVAPLLALVKARPGDALPADLLYLTALRLLETGDLPGALEVQRALLEGGSAHPRYESWNLAAVATASSRQWRSRCAAVPGCRAVSREELKQAVSRLSGWRAWVDDDRGLMLLGKAWAAVGDFESARAAWRQVYLSGDAGWRKCASAELVALTEPGKALADADSLLAPAGGAVAVDGKLDEPFWANAASRRLEPNVKAAAPTATAPKAAAPTATARLSATPAGLAIAIRLDSPPARAADPSARAVNPPAPPPRDPVQADVQWQLVACFDSDRDGWTQAVLRCDSTGKRSAALATRLWGQLQLPPELLPVDARKDKAGWSIELVARHALLGTSPERMELLRVQLALTLRLDDADPVTLYLAPAPTEPLSPHHYALVALSPAEPARP